MHFLNKFEVLHEIYRRVKEKNSDPSLLYLVHFTGYDRDDCFLWERVWSFAPLLSSVSLGGPSRLYVEVVGGESS